MHMILLLTDDIILQDNHISGPGTYRDGNTIKSLLSGTVTISKIGEDSKASIQTSVNSLCSSHGLIWHMPQCAAV